MSAAETPPAPAPARSTRWVCVLLFVLVAAAVFLARAGSWWRGGELLAGNHPDGPFHYACELTRLAPGALASDLAIQASRSLGAYEAFYRSVNGLSKLTGLSLLETNLAMCWAANFLYLGGVFVLLRVLKLAPWACALGTWLAAQPFILIGMSGGVNHWLAIPREVWLWPLPWFVLWFATGRREGVALPVFYGTLGAVYCMTYPLWAALFGVAFGLADAWPMLRARRWNQLAWLAAGGALCLLVVALPALATFRAVGGGDGAVLDYNQITRSVYFTKGFRRLLLFAGAGLAALWWWNKSDAAETGPAGRLNSLLLASLLVCFAYEPVQRLMPSLSMLYAGRLSVVAFLVSMVAVTVWLQRGASVLPAWGRALLVAAVLGASWDPVRAARKDFAAQAPPARTDFVEFCRKVKEATKPATLAVVEPTIGAHYFRVYAERGLWIHTKDTGVLSRTRGLYSQGRQRMAKLNALYAESTSQPERESLLAQLRADGVTHMVTRSDFVWAAGLSWPVVLSHETWQLHAPP